ncbi:MAG: exo-alpha-sialidase [Rhodobacteraceae bacterium]|nr:exo-alpha-sialidase [Paracoccaceae bacterium]
MATDITSTQPPAGLVLADPRLTDPAVCLWDDECDYTEADARPGTPVAPSGSLLTLEASGDTQTTDGALTAVVLEGGTPGATAGAATVGYSRASQAVRGWEAPCTISASRVVAWKGADSYADPVVLGLASGRVVVAACTATELLTWTSDDEGLTFDGPTTVWTGAAASPCLVWSEEAGLLLLATASTGTRIRVYRSSDYGDSWSLVSRGTTAVEASQRIVAAAQGREVLVIGHHRSTPSGSVHGMDLLNQYISLDWGASWTLVSTRRESYTSAGALLDEGSGWPSLAARPDGGYLLAWLGTVSSSSAVVRLATLTSGATPVATLESIDLTTAPGGADWSEAPANVTTSGGHHTQASADLCVMVDDAGCGWVTLRVADTAAARPYRHSWLVAWAPDCQTWRAWGMDPLSVGDRGDAGMWWRANDTGDHYPSGARACYHRGRVLVAHGFTAQEAAADGPSVLVTQLGGYSSVTQPRILDAVEMRERGHYDRTHLPIERLSDSSDWTATTAGAFTWALNAAGYEGLTTGDGVGLAGQAYAEWTSAAVASANGRVHYEVRATQAASVAAKEVAIDLRLGNGTTTVQVSLRHLPGTIALYDDLAGGGAGAALAAWASLDTGLPVQVRLQLSLDGLAVRCWWRQPSAPLEEDRGWTELGTGPHTVASAASASGNRLRVGHIASAGAGSQVRSRWYQVHHAIGAETAESLAGVEGRWEQADPEDYLAGRPLTGRPVYLADGVSVAASSGPAVELEEHVITAEGLHPVRRAWPSVALSPRDGARLTSGAAHTLAVQLFSGSTSYECAVPEVMAVAVAGCNWGSCTVEGYTSGAWASIGTLDLTGGLSLAYTRRGNVLLPSGTSTLRLRPGELVGATMALGSYRRRVVAHSEGLWSDATGGPTPQIVLEAVTGSEPGSGTAYPWYPSGVLLFATGTTRYRGLRLVWASTTTADNWLALGALHIGRVYPLARPDWGQQLSRELTRDLEESPTGRVSLVRRGPSRRVVEIDWAEVGADLTDAHRSADGGSYLRSGPTQKGATRGAHGLELQAIDERYPVVYLPQLGPDAALPRMVVRPHEHLYALPAGPPSMQQVLGTWGTDELVTVSALTLRELV